MIVHEIYNEARKENHYSLVLLIEFLLLEKKVLKETDSEDKLTYYLQEKFHEKVNQHLIDYEKNRFSK